MKQCIRQHKPFSTTNPALQVAIQEELNAITSEELIALVDSVPTRVREVTFFSSSVSSYIALPHRFLGANNSFPTL